MQNYANINLSINGAKKSIKIEKGCFFKNNGGIYHVDDSGKLNFFDKEKKTMESG